MWNDRYSARGSSLWARAAFDPATLAVGSMVSTAIGAAASATSTLAGGAYAAQAGRVQKQELYGEAGTAIGAAQRKMFDTQDRTRRAIGTLQANAGASGVAADTGSPLETTGELAQRGSYHALMDLWNGENQADKLRYQGDLAETEGKMKQSASWLSAAGTIAGAAGSTLDKYGAFKYPTRSGRAGVSL